MVTCAPSEWESILLVSFLTPLYQLLDLQLYPSMTKYLGSASWSRSTLGSTITNWACDLCPQSEVDLFSCSIVNHWSITQNEYECHSFISPPPNQICTIFGIHALPTPPPTLHGRRITPPCPE